MRSLDDFLTVWNSAERKQAILGELAANRASFFDELAEQVGRDYDAFDLVCHVAFDQPALTRERADKVVKRNVFGKVRRKARAVLEACCRKYADSGISGASNPSKSQGGPLDHIRHAG